MQLLVISALLASLNLEFSLLKKGEIFPWLFGWISRIVAGVVFGIVVWFLFMPAIVGPLGGAFPVIGWFLVINVLFTAKNTLVAMFTTWKIPAKDVLLGFGLISLFVIVNIYFQTLHPVINNQRLRGMLGEVTTKQEYPPEADKDNILIVPEEAARFDADKMMGNPIQELNLNTAGSLFSVGELFLQKIKTESGTKLVWVGPLEYRDLIKSITTPYSPGYILINAEDASENPRLVTNHKINYLSSGFFLKNIDRHIYLHGYATYTIDDIVFSIDDEMNPHFVASLSRPSIGYTADKIEKILIINPDTGEITDYNFGDTTLPTWVDRVVPENLVENRLAWWGEYILGFWNTVITQRDIIMPVGIRGNVADVYFASLNGDLSWVIGFTSKGTVDTALAGLMYVSTTTGKATYYTWVPKDQTPPNLSNEEDAYDAVEKALSINSGAYTPGQPVMYRINARQVYIVPILARDSNRQEGIALYDAQEQKTFLGDDFKGTTRAIAFAKHLTWLKSKGSFTNTSSTTKIEGNVTAFMPIVSEGKTVFRLQIDAKPDMVFEGADNLSPRLWATKVGDTVNVDYIAIVEEKGSGIIQLVGFEKK